MEQAWAIQQQAAKDSKPLSPKEEAAHLKAVRELIGDDEFLAELVVRLRSVNSEQAPYANDLVLVWCHEAADTITRLQGEVERLEADLNAALGHMMNAKIDLDTGAPKRTAAATLSSGIRRATAALKETDNG